MGKIAIERYSADSIIEIYAPRDSRFFSSQPLLKTGWLISKIKGSFTHSSSNTWGTFSSTESSYLFHDGLDCQILEIGAEGWRKGKLKIVLEFVPEEPEKTQSPEVEQTESPLDAIRQMVGE